ncbi:MAG: S1 RNA-binding domain-containing protein [Chitinivibrionales bacterium]|nr:S1 RNA-binding domain-containing protein [Chitinivibrionales bacterium]
MSHSATIEEILGRREVLMQEKNYDGFFDESTEAQTPQQELIAMVDALDTKPVAQVQQGATVTGKVSRIGKDYVFVDIGYKNEAIIKNSEYSTQEGGLSVEPGDTITAHVISVANDEILLSKSLSAKHAGTKELMEALKNKMPVQGKVTGINKGGFNVTVMGKKAFCPFSHIDLKHVDDPNAYLLKVFEFIITRVENRGNNIVVSRLPLLEKDLVDHIVSIEEICAKKSVISGTISKITDYGLFVNLGEVEGLVHISEVSWDRAQNLNDEFKIGQPVECIILSVERKEPLRNSKISLSIKMASENPWTTITSKLSIGESVEGTITRLTSFGAFVQLLPGIEGLIHISELSWGKRVRHPADVVAEGQKVKVTILGINEEKRSVSCSLKDVANNPWNEVPVKYPVGTVVSGKVAEETKYGYFVDLDDYITGLLVHGKVAKNKKGTIKKGDSIDVAIEEIDLDSRRISLSHGLDPEQRAAPVEQVKIEQRAPSQAASSEFGDLLKAAIARKQK